MPQQLGSNDTVFCEGALWFLVPGLLEGVAAAITGDWAEEEAEKPGFPNR